MSAIDMKAEYLAHASEPFRQVCESVEEGVNVNASRFANLLSGFGIVGGKLTRENARSAVNLYRAMAALTVAAGESIDTEYVQTSFEAFADLFYKRGEFRSWSDMHLFDFTSGEARQVRELLRQLMQEEETS